MQVIQEVAHTAVISWDVVSCNTDDGEMGYEETEEKKGELFSCPELDYLTAVLLNQGENSQSQQRIDKVLNAVLRRIHLIKLQQMKAAQPPSSLLLALLFSVSCFANGISAGAATPRSHAQRHTIWKLLCYHLLASHALLSFQQHAHKCLQQQEQQNDTQLHCRHDEHLLDCSHVSGDDESLNGRENPSMEQNQVL